MTPDQVDVSHQHTILIVSGGVGASGEQLVHTVLAQFPESRVQVITIPNVRFESQIEETVQRAEKLGATLVHTLVDANLRAYLEALAAERKVMAIDLMGELLTHLTQALGKQPLGQPGLYRLLNRDYFDRVAAIEYTMAHDDGKNPEGWAQAEIVLVGVSRAGKTPLSLYLSVLGWKVANVPLVIGLDLPAQFFQLDPRRVFGLKIEAGQLLAFRQQRQQRLGAAGPSDYVNPEKILEELEYAAGVFKRGGFRLINVTDKPIESCADEVIRQISGRAASPDSRL
jgi:regulator of PEP synthase PpsR (kinase-PPPase family)